MEQEQNTKIAEQIAESTGPCVEHPWRASVARIRRFSIQLENACDECFDRFVVRAYPRSGRATEARKRLAKIDALINGGR